MPGTRARALSNGNGGGCGFRGASSSPADEKSVESRHVGCRFTIKAMRVRGLVCGTDFVATT